MTDQGPAKLRLADDRDQTLDRLAELERDFALILTSASEGSAGSDDEHDPEGATLAFERQHIAALAAQARDHLASIDAALAKIDSGVYEICDMCGGEIGMERLVARPASLICVRCAGTRR